MEAQLQIFDDFQRIDVSFERPVFAAEDAAFGPGRSRNSQVRTGREISSRRRARKAGEQSNESDNG